MGAFNNDVCIGAAVWDTDSCNGGICSITVNGFDGSAATQGYITSGEIPSLQIYDASEHKYFSATPSSENQWYNFSFQTINVISL